MCLHRLGLEPGCALVCDNYRWLHGREGFSDEPPEGAAEEEGGGDHEAGEGKGRLMIRLWLQTDHFK